MISSEMWFTPTRATGIVAYAVAAFCSVVAWLRSKHKLAAWMAVVELLLLIDIITNGRWLLHDLLGRMAESQHEYGLRRVPQMVAIALLVAILIAGLLTLLRVYRGRTGAVLAISGALISCITWCVEVISLHQVDAILYHPLGGRWMAVIIIWLLAALMTSVGTLLDSRRRGASS